MKRPVLNVFVCRDFSIGFTVFSPTMNGICFEIRFACFGVRFWSKGNEIKFNNYWVDK